MNILIIANPIASGGDAGKRAGLLAAILNRRGHQAEPYLTRFAGDGKQRVSEIGPDDFDRIVVVGGDGTFNEIINGLPPGVSIPIAQLPTGNANLLGKDLSLPRTPAGTADLIENGRVIMADLAEMNSMKFIMIAGAGFDAKVTEALNAVRTGRVSNLSYALPTLRTLRDGRRMMFHVAVDGRHRARGEIVLVNNVRSYGGICEMAFDAGVDSGNLDIIVLPKENAESIAKYFFMARFSRITRLKDVAYLKGRQVTITADTPIPMQLDGDFAGHFPEVHISLKPNYLPIMGP
ncbi:MAG: diacylglycerol kinase family lipid kinase [Desulfobacteraceae bacterium]|nr:MAG: diacylglycerol kinase family lipid kinase [Desulfobacteraceae bacterium]